jgi:hypothetical protein
MGVLTRAAKGSRLTSGEMDANLGYCRTYEVYTATLSAIGAAQPTASVFQNTLGNTITWSRTGTGSYMGIASGAFTTNTLTVVSNASPSASYGYTLYKSDVNTVRLVAASSSVVLDGLLSNVPVEIRVY